MGFAAPLSKIIQQKKWQVYKESENILHLCLYAEQEDLGVTDTVQTAARAPLNETFNTGTDVRWWVMSWHLSDSDYNDRRAEIGIYLIFLG